MTQNAASSGIKVGGKVLNEDTASSLELLYDHTYDVAVAVGTKVLTDPSAAEDVAQETMIRAAQRLEDGMPLEEVQDLVPIIAYGIAVDEYRSRGEIPAGLGQADDLLGNVLGARALTPEAARFIVTFDGGLRDLEEDERDAFILTNLRGLTLREAAEVLSTSFKTVHRRAETARTYLQEEIAA